MKKSKPSDCPVPATSETDPMRTPSGWVGGLCLQVLLCQERLERLVRSDEATRSDSVIESSPTSRGPRGQVWCFGKSFIDRYGIYGGFMGFYGGFMGFSGGLMGFNGIYPNW